MVTTRALHQFVCIGDDDDVKHGLAQCPLLQVRSRIRQVLSTIQGRLMAVQFERSC
jgi:hypothetical protein